jgi:hypothetical protein
MAIKFMLKLGLAGLLLAFVSNGHVAKAATTEGVPCGASAIYDDNASGTTLLITGTSKLKTYVCGFDIFSAGTVTVQLTYGTGNSCTGAHPITPAFQMVANGSLVDPSPQWRGLVVVPAGNNVCIVTNAGTAVQALIFYVPAP